MRYRRIVNGEPSYGQSQQDFLQGIEAVGQAIATRLRLYSGEWWEDIYDGLPVWTNLLGYEGANKTKSNAIIKARILGTKLGTMSLVTSVENITNTYSSTTRKYTFKGYAKSVYGYISISS